MRLRYKPTDRRRLAWFLVRILQKSECWWLGAIGGIKREESRGRRYKRCSNLAVQECPAIRNVFGPGFHLSLVFLLRPGPHEKSTDSSKNMDQTQIKQCLRDFSIFFFFRVFCSIDYFINFLDGDYGIFIIS